MGCAQGALDSTLLRRVEEESGMAPCTQPVQMPQDAAKALHGKARSHSPHGVGNRGELMLVRISVAEGRAAEE